MSCLVVPWYNKEEWLKVYDNLFNIDVTADQKAEAIKYLLIWKARYPWLPSGIESTLGIVQVLHLDLNSVEQPLVQQHVLRLAYSSAIMRFVNHMLDSESAKGSSLYKAAKKLGVPDWIIDLRHNTAHNNSLPTLQLLREAADIALNWLQKNYWNKHKEVIADYVINTSTDDIEDKLVALTRFYVSLSICMSSSCEVKKFADIADTAMRNSLMTEARHLLGDYSNVSNSINVSILTLINAINTQYKQTLLKRKKAAAVIAKALVNDKNSLFMSHEMVSLLSQNEFKHNKLSMQYINCFEVFLTFLHSNNVILDLILELISLTQNCEVKGHTRKLGALWVSEILQSLKRSNFFIEKIKMGRLDEESNDNSKLLYQHWHPNEKEALYMDLQKPIPQELTELDFVEKIVSTYNPYLTYFVKPLLELVKPCLADEIMNKICKLSNVIARTKAKGVYINKVHTVDDVCSLQNNPMVHRDRTLSDDSVEIIDLEDMDTSTLEDAGSSWTLTSIKHNWANCPIGDLPWKYNPEKSMHVDK